jgi:hypothetical protein
MRSFIPIALLFASLPNAQAWDHGKVDINRDHLISVRPFGFVVRARVKADGFVRKQHAYPSMKAFCETLHKECTK